MLNFIRKKRGEGGLCVKEVNNEECAEYDKQKEKSRKISHQSEDGNEG